MVLWQPGETRVLFQTVKPNILLLSYVPFKLHSIAKTACNACYMAIPQFTLVPYDIDKTTLGFWGPLFFFYNLVHIDLRTFYC